MKVTSSYHPVSYTPQKTGSKTKNFSDMYANTVANELTKTSISSVKVIGTPISGNHGFIPFRLLTGQVDTTRKLNMDSKGDKELTAEEIQSLHEKYDFENMSKQEQYNFYCDLTDMGVLTAADVEAIGTSDIRLKGRDVFSLSAENLFPLAPSEEILKGNLYEWMQDFVEREQADYDYILELGMKAKKADKSQYDDSVKMAISDFEKNSTDIDKIMTSHKKVLGLISSLWQQ